MKRKNMRVFKKWLEDMNREPMPEGNVPADWFFNNQLPMIVECSCCTMTMAIPSAIIDEDQNIYCRDCSGIDEL